MSEVRSRREVIVDTPVGEGRWLLHEASSTVSWWLLLGHGAGGGLEAPDLIALTRHLPPQGITVGLFEQPWRRSGKKMTARPPVLDQAWLAAVEALRPEIDDARLALGGRSAGARVACRTAVALRADAVVNLAFPLHPPGKAESSRLPELLGSGVPTLTLQGEKDPFGGTDELLQALGVAHRDDARNASVAAQAEHVVVRVPGAAHDLKVPARHPDRAASSDLVERSVLEFLTAEE